MPGRCIISSIHGKSAGNDPFVLMILVLDAKVAWFNFTYQNNLKNEKKKEKENSLL